VTESGSVRYVEAVYMNVSLYLFVNPYPADVEAAIVSLVF
jgi:hypothetical protein